MVIKNKCSYRMLIGMDFYGSLVFMQINRWNPLICDRCCDFSTRFCLWDRKMHITTNAETGAITQGPLIIMIEIFGM